MTPVERLQAAIEKLEQLRGESQNWRVSVSADEDGPQVIHDFDTEDHGPGSGPLAWTTSEQAAVNIVTLYRTIDAQLLILRDNQDWISVYREESLPLAARGAVALADAILGDHS